MKKNKITRIRIDRARCDGERLAFLFARLECSWMVGKTVALW
jgi:hypothetical protein